MKGVSSSPAICTVVRSKACQIRRSLSRNSIDVKGAFVLEKVWTFEGEDIGHGSQDNLSESDDARDAWCSKHCWFLSTNLLTSQSCARCLKRILPKRAVYKCKACKRLCHLKCAAEPNCGTFLDSSIYSPKAEGVFSRKRPAEKPADMNLQAFVADHDCSPMQSCKFVRKETPKRHNGKRPFQRLDIHKQNGGIEFTERAYSLDEELPHDSTIDKKQIVDSGLSGELQKSHKKQGIFSLRENIVKRCRSIKKKVKNIRDKSFSSEEKPSMEEEPSSQCTSRSSADPDAQASDDREAWARSPVRTRLRTRQLELRRESMRAKILGKKRLERNPENSTWPTFRKSGRPLPAFDKALDGICDRLEVVEQRVCKLETSIPLEIAEWRKLQKQFQMEVITDNSKCQDQYAEKTYKETCPKRLEAEGQFVSTSSGTTSDEIYVVPEYPSIKSYDLSGHMMHNTVHMGYGLDNMMPGSDAISQKEHSVMYSPITSNNDSMPSGLYNKNLLNVQSRRRGDDYIDHQTSTPVTAREMSFRSASRNYEKTHQIRHTNVTTISVDHSYTSESHAELVAPAKSVEKEKKYEFEMGTKVGCAVKKSDCLDDVDGPQTHVFRADEKYISEEFKFENAPRSPKEKVLSPEQLAVKSFLSKRSSEQKKPNIVVSNITSKVQSADLCQSADTECPDLQSPGIVRQLISHFNQSPPIASSTFYEGSHLSPSFTFRHDPEASHYSFAKIDHEESNSDHRQEEKGPSKNASSRSDLEHTFVLRNDSQMIYTNASEDLPGYTRNHSFFVGSTLGAAGQTYLDDSESEHREPVIRMEVKADIETDAPREFDRLVKSSKSDQRPSPGSVSKDCLSLTNVTELTGDYFNSFADVRENVGKCDAANVSRFQRDQLRPTSRGKIDETGDGRKPPCIRKYNHYVPDVDFLKEAKKRLETFRKKRSGEADAGITLEKLPRIPVSMDSDVKPAGVNGICAYVETCCLPEKHFDCLTTGSRVYLKDAHENALAKNKCSPQKALDEVSNSGKKIYENPAETNKETGKNGTIDCKHMVDSTKEFEDIEKQLQEQSLASKHRISLSLTHLPNIDSLSHEQSHRQKSFSCTNSIDGDARSLMNDSARYHFLNDKGMIKISSPSLKLLCEDQGNAPRKPRSRRYNNIDEESDVEESESGSEMSGEYFVDSKFHIPQLNYGKTSSEIGSRQSKSDTVYSEMTEMTPSTELDENRQLDLENHHFEEMLKDVDAYQKDMDAVVSWINNRYNDDEDVGEYEHELEMLMNEQEGSHSVETDGFHSVKTEPGSSDHQIGSCSNLQSPSDDSVYYSVLGQSLELKNVVSPGRMDQFNNPVTKMDDELCAGLMETLKNGSVQDVTDFLNSDRTISELEIRQATLWALEKENFEITMLLLNDICKLICAAEEDNCVDVFPAYRESKRWKPIFVILTKQNFQGDWDTFMGFPVYRRRYDLVNSEAAMVVNSVFVRKHPLKVEDFKTVKRALDSVDLHKQHRNITLINACSCKSKKNGKVIKKGLCIVIHCLIKGFIPFDEEPFPKELSGIPVDVREGYFRLGVGTPIGESNAQGDTSVEGEDTEQDISGSSGSLGTKSETHSESESRSQISGSETRSRSKTEHVNSQSSLSVGGQSNSRSCSDIEEKEGGKIQRQMEKKAASKNSSPDSKFSVDSFKRLPSPRKRVGKESPQKKTKRVLDDHSYETDSDIGELVAKAMGPGGDVMLHNNNVQYKEIQPCGHGDTLGSLLIGSSISLVGRAKRGTLGGFVVLPGGELGFIAAGHVVRAAATSEGAKVCVFSDGRTGNQGDWYVCGEVAKVVQSEGKANMPGVDVGVVRITSHQPLQAGFRPVPEQVLKNAGFCNNSRPNFERGHILSWTELFDDKNDGGTQVLKFGATTGLTLGHIYGECAYAHQEGYQNCRDNERITLLHQLEILGAYGSPHGFFRAGDSGSLVFVSRETDLQCVAIAIGYTSYGSCIATPIEAVFEAIGPGIKFVDFTLCQSSF
ncbi:uncharacterized protein LOC127867805 isoform X2 [Dreissena polymorpha]|nr:uncharacterized protein LOC127867805 isoform X2 [Dreissena polymorpha]